MKWLTDSAIQFGGSPVKVGEEEYHLFRDSEYVPLQHNDILSSMTLY
jgi:hypothetical protein